MKKNVLILLVFFFVFTVGNTQVYLEQFDSDNGNTYTSTGYVGSFADSEWTITADGSNGPYDPFGYTFEDDAGTPISVDITGNNKIFVRAKASSLGTQMRMDIKDANGFVSTIDNVTQTLVNDYVILEFSYGAYQDGGYGGTACDAADAPCAVDGTQVTELVIFLNPGQPGYQGTAVFDFIAVGEAPSTGPMSDVYEEHFEGDSITKFLFYGEGHTGEVIDGVWTISGDGTAGPWNPMEYYFHNMTTLDSADVDLSAGDNKIFIRMKANVDGLAVRCDAQDIDGFITTLGSVTKIVDSEWKTIEYDLTGLFEDLGYGGTPCTEDTAPCAVDASRIRNLTFFITPGVEAFSGQLEMEYISIGTALEAPDPNANQLVYGDHFNDGILTVVSDGGEWDLAEADSELTLVGNGSAAPYAAAAYTPLASDGTAALLDLSGNNKLFIEGRSTKENTLLRIDLVDSAGYVTSMPALTKVLGNEDNILEYDFSGQYIDAGYGGTSCETGPCPVDPTAISTILIYPDADAGMFEGTINLDFLATGGILGEDIGPYSDQFDNDINVLVDPDGFTSIEASGELVLTGDGSAGAYTAYAYDLHDQEDGSSVLADFTLNNKFYVKAKSTVNGVPFRVDVIDEDGFVSNAVAQVNSLTEEYTVLEYDFTGAYQDGGYGGTPCMSDDAPCDVNGSRIVTLLFYIDADAGGFAGNVTLDWISTQDPLENIGDPGPVGVDEYFDEFANGIVDNIEGMDGFSVSESDGNLTITGDGTSGAYAPIVYNTHNQDDESIVLVNAVNNADKLYIRAMSSVAELPLRIDLQDNEGYVTSLASLTESISSEDMTIYEYSFTGGYLDGGFGGTPCTAGPCEVDGERIAAAQFFILPGEGLFNGTLDIDWISFGEPLTINTQNSELIVGSSLYPNPNQGSFNVVAEFTQSVNEVEMTIFDIVGRKVYSIITNPIGSSMSANIDLTTINSGAYILQASTKGELLFNHRIMIK